MEGEMEGEEGVRLPWVDSDLFRCYCLVVREGIKIAEESS